MTLQLAVLIYFLIGMVVGIYNYVLAVKYHPGLGYKAWLRGAILSWLFWLPAFVYWQYIHHYKKEILDDCPHCRSDKGSTR